MDPENNDEEFDIIMPDGEDEVEIIDDTPPEDKGRLVASEDSEDDDDAPIEGLGDRAKKRIDKLTAEKHAERRAKEQVARERDEAVRVAREALTQAQALKNQTNQYEQGFVYTAKSKAEIEIEQANAEYTKAFENGDSKGMAEAMRKGTTAQIAKAQFDNYVPQPSPQAQPNVPTQPQQAPQINREEVARQTKFIRENPWFNQDQEMTERALQIDAHVRQTAPQLVGTDEYYDFVDAMMKQSFPKEKFASTQAHAAQRAPTQGVAPVSRASGATPGTRKKITLTESQVKLAKRLGITPQQYAAELIKEQSK